MRINPLSISILSGLLLLTACSAPTPSDNTAETSSSSSSDEASIPQAVHNARIALATKLNVQARSIIIVEAEETEWSDSCLGLGGPAESCLAAMTPGYDVLLSYEGVDYNYRTNADGSSVREEE